MLRSKASLAESLDRLRLNIFESELGKLMARKGTGEFLITQAA